MKKLVVLFAMIGSGSVLAAETADVPAPMCDRVSISFRSDSSGRVDPEKLKNVQNEMIELLADRGYTAKYVTFYAPGSDLPPSYEAEIQRDAGDQPRVLVEVSYTDELFTRNLALRIYKLEARPPYHSLPYYNGNETIGPVHVGGVNLKHRFKKLLGAKEMLDCPALAAKSAP